MIKHWLVEEIERLWNEREHHTVTISVLVGIPEFKVDMILNEILRRRHEKHYLATDVLDGIVSDSQRNGGGHDNNDDNTPIDHHDDDNS